MKQHLQKGQYVEKRFRASKDDIEVKEDGEGRKRVRMPISSTAEDRDGDEFSSDGLNDLRDQINAGKVPAFLDHGRGSRGGWYGALGIVGTWDEATIETESHEGESIDILYADFVPTEANEDAADIVALLEDDMPVGASVGFRIIDYERDRDEGKLVFHSTDLLETSIVGIPSNPLTVNDGADAIGAKALGSPDVPIALQRGYGGQHQAGQFPQQAHLQVREPNPPGIAERWGSGSMTRDDVKRYIDESIADLERQLTGRSEARNGSSPNTDSPSEPNSGSDPDTTMSNPDDDGGDDPANKDDELREAVSEQTDAVRELTSSIDSFLEQERSADPDDAAGNDGGADPEGKDNESDDEDTVQLFVGEDADEDVRKEFEALREKANDDGEIDLADSDTKLFGSDDGGDTDDNGDSGTSGVTI